MPINDHDQRVIFFIDLIYTIAKTNQTSKF